MDTERATYTVQEAAKVLGISRGLAYEMARSGAIPTVRLGKRLLVSRRALTVLLESQSKPTPSALDVRDNN